MKKTLLFLYCALFSIWLTGQNWEWLKIAGGLGNDCQYNFSLARTADIVTDENGNSYVTGYFSGTAQFGSFSLNSAGGEDIFIAKYNPRGVCLWAKSAGGTDIDHGRAVSIDKQGNLYVTGFFKDTATFDTTNLVSRGGSDIFIAKYTQNGNIIWSKKAGGTNGGTEDGGFGICNDNAGNIYVTGVFSGTSTFDSFFLTHGGTFIARYDSVGNCVWAKQSNNSSLHDPAKGIQLSPSNESIYVTGYFVNFISFGSDTLAATGGNQDIYLTKLDTSGNFLWGRNVGGAYNNDFGRDLTLDPNENIYLIGSFQNTATFGTNTTITSSPFSRDNVFIAKYDSSGNFKWVDKVGTNSNGTIGHSIQYGAHTNRLYVSGLFHGTATFGNNGPGLVSQGLKDAFVAQYDTSGTCIWARSARGTNNQVAYNISLDAVNDVYVVGSFENAIQYGTNTLFTNGGSDFFIAKLNANPNSVGIEDNTDTDKMFELYPNPSNGQFTLALRNKIDGELMLYDINAKLIHQDNFNKAQMLEMDLELESGVYFIKLNSNDSTWVEKIIVR